MYPKIIVFDVEWTLIKSWMDPNKLGKGPGAKPIPEDNLEYAEGGWQLRDKTNHGEYYWLCGDVPEIFTDVLRNGAKIGIISRNKRKALIDRVLWMFNADDPNKKKRRPLIEMATFDEVYDKDKTEHLKAIQGYSGVDYSDMLLFDDEAINYQVRVVLGVTFQVSRDGTGVTMSNYREGIEQWKRCKQIRSPFIDTNISSYPKRMFIGYAGMDEATANLLIHGKNRTDLTESARWGHACYVADNPALARYFADWIKRDAFGANAKTFVCEIWARDRDLFTSVNKVWAPEDGNMMTDVKTKDAFKIGWAQEDRDRTVAQWGIQTPYILFSRHFKMAGMPVPGNQRWNEMVIYSQVQNALLLAVPLSDAELNAKINGGFTDFTTQIRPWNIHIPDITKADFQRHGERFV